MLGDMEPFQQEINLRFEAQSVCVAIQINLITTNMVLLERTSWKASCTRHSSGREIQLEVESPITINAKKLTKEVHVDGTTSLSIGRISTKIDTDIIYFISSVKSSIKKLSRKYQFTHSGVPQRLTVNRIKERYYTFHIAFIYKY
jgi:hypothetical protein